MGAEPVVVLYASISVLNLVLGLGFGLLDNLATLFFM